MRQEALSCWRMGQKVGEAGQYQGSGSCSAGPMSCACLWLFVSLKWCSEEAGKEFSSVPFTLDLVTPRKTLPLEAISKNTYSNILRQLKIPAYEGVRIHTIILQKPKIRKFCLNFCLQKSASPTTAHLSSLLCPTPISISTFAKRQERHGSAILFPSFPKAGKFHLIQDYSMASMQAERLESDGGQMLYSKLLHASVLPPLPPSLLLPKLRHPQQSGRNALHQGGEVHKIITLSLLLQTSPHIDISLIRVDHGHLYTPSFPHVIPSLPAATIMWISRGVMDKIWLYVWY